MAAALWKLVDSARERMPLKRKDEDEIHMPFREKVYLFRLLVRWNDAQWLRRSQRSDGEICARGLQTTPNYSTFRRVLRREEFSKLKFHRVVDMGRCPLCCLLRYKVASSEPIMRPYWEEMASKHQFLQMAQKKVYYKARRAVVQAGVLVCHVSAEVDRLPAPTRTGCWPSSTSLTGSSTWPSTPVPGTILCCLT
jgi:hypothetical protein